MSPEEFCQGIDEKALHVLNIAYPGGLNALLAAFNRKTDELETLKRRIRYVLEAPEGYL